MVGGVGGFVGGVGGFVGGVGGFVGGVGGFVRQSVGIRMVPVDSLVCRLFIDGVRGLQIM